MNVIVSFADQATEAKAFGKLAGRFSFKTWSSGETMVPEPALAFLAAENIEFQVKGRATYQHYAPLRSPAAP